MVVQLNLAKKSLLFTCINVGSAGKIISVGKSALPKDSGRGGRERCKSKTWICMKYQWIISEWCPWIWWDISGQPSSWWLKQTNGKQNIITATTAANWQSTYLAHLCISIYNYEYVIWEWVFFIIFSLLHCKIRKNLLHFHSSWNVQKTMSCQTERITETQNQFSVFVQYNTHICYPVPRKLNPQQSFENCVWPLSEVCVCVTVW